jgi:hypothetical protein
MGPSKSGSLAYESTPCADIKSVASSHEQVSIGCLSDKVRCVNEVEFRLVKLPCPISRQVMSWSVNEVLLVSDADQ